MQPRGAKATNNHSPHSCILRRSGNEMECIAGIK